jgi:hypothetical protein
MDSLAVAVVTAAVEEPEGFSALAQSDGLGNVTLDATDWLPYYGNQSVATCG